MSTADNKAIVLRYAEEVFNCGELAAVDTYIDPHYLRYDPGVPFTVQGGEGLKQLVTAYRIAFPDFHVEPTVVVANGDMVGVQWRARGTHLGDLMGMPPTGNSFTVDTVEIFRLAGGKIVEQWIVVDDSLAQQLGVAA
jgi:predicted ester cyclase